MRAWTLCLLLSCGGIASERPAAAQLYGGLTPQNGEHPGPKGAARVLLRVEGRLASPLLCYDPLWARLKGPEDCADLIPPGARISGRAVVARGPLACAARRGVALTLDEAAPTGWVVWRDTRVASPHGATPSVDLLAAPDAVEVDLDEDGRLERVRSEGSTALGPAPLGAWPCL
ncbi:hypothetical protein KKF91_11730 [Myxococcota bacterium]|nr:hypothetical protein [Myxococcota bacterium]